MKAKTFIWIEHIQQAEFIEHSYKSQAEHIQGAEYIEHIQKTECIWLQNNQKNLFTKQNVSNIQRAKRIEHIQ